MVYQSHNNTVIDALFTYAVEKESLNKLRNKQT